MSEKDNETPEELQRWIWNRFVGAPVAGKLWEDEFNFLGEQIKRFHRRAFTEGLNDARKQMHDLAAGTAASPRGERP